MLLRAFEKEGSDTRLRMVPSAGAGWKSVTLQLPAADLGAHLGVGSGLRTPFHSFLKRPDNPFIN